MVITTPLEAFQSIPCFSAIGLEALDGLVQGVKEVSFAKGQTVFLEGEPCPGLYVVTRGAVKLYHSTPNGEEQIVRVVHRGGCFECVPLLDGGANAVSAEAFEAADLYLLTTADFTRLFVTSPELALQFSAVLARRLRALVNVVGDFSVRRVPPRLAALLLQLAVKRDGEMMVSPSVPLSQQHLACMLGCSRQAVNSALRKLVAERSIRMEGHRIVIVDAEALRNLV